MNFFGPCFSKEEVKVEEPKPVFKIDSDEDRKYMNYNVLRGRLVLGAIVYIDGEWGWEATVHSSYSHSPNSYNSHCAPRLEADEFQAIADKINQLNLEKTK